MTLEKEQKKNNLQKVYEVIKTMASKPSGLIGLSILLFHVILAITSPLYVPYDYKAIDPSLMLQAPSSEYWFGTDSLGRDVFTRTILGGRTALTVTFFGSLIALLWGGALGIFCGLVGGKIDDVVMRIIDAFLSIPWILAMLLIVSLLGTTTLVLIPALGFFYGKGIVRVARAATHYVIAKDFIVSARARDINAGPFDDFIQTDASINRGNSGGPLFNLKGQVIGVNTAIYSPSGGSVGIGFAIPSALAENIVEQLEEHGRTIRGWLGVRIQTVTEDLASSLGLDRPYGALVASVIPNSPAEKAGIKPGDVILDFNGNEVTEMRKLPRLVAETKVNSNSKVTIWRNEKKKSLNVVIAEMKEEKKEIQESKDNTVPDTLQSDYFNQLGITLSSITQDIRMRQNIPEDVSGLLVTKVEQNTDAEIKGIRPGDIIQEINQSSVNDINAFRKIMDSLKGSKKGVLLLINRQGNINFVALKLN